MRFTKMHGIGKDYVYVSPFDQRPPVDPVALARAVSDRHTGIGGDELILIMPSERADARMRMFNADGSEGEMCGNGVRCVAKYLFDHGLATLTLLAHLPGGDLELHWPADNASVFMTGPATEVFSGEWPD